MQTIPPASETPSEPRPPDESPSPAGAGNDTLGGSPRGEGNGSSGLFWATYRAARRVVVAVVGSTVLLLGLVLLVTPGPAMVVIPIGLGILALEFAWARRWLDQVREGAGRLMSLANGNRRGANGKRRDEDETAARPPAADV